MPAPALAAAARRAALPHARAVAGRRCSAAWPACCGAGGRRVRRPVRPRSSPRLGGYRPSALARAEIPAALPAPLPAGRPAVRDRPVDPRRDRVDRDQPRPLHAAGVRGGVNFARLLRRPDAVQHHQRPALHLGRLRRRRQPRRHARPPMTRRRDPRRRQVPARRRRPRRLPAARSSPTTTRSGTSTDVLAKAARVPRRSPPRRAARDARQHPRAAAQPAARASARCSAPTCSAAASTRG